MQINLNIGARVGQAANLIFIKNLVSSHSRMPYVHSDVRTLMRCDMTYWCTSTGMHAEPRLTIRYFEDGGYLAQ